MKQLVLLFLVLSISAFAGNDDKYKSAVKNISSKVVASNGEEIAGVKITVKETGESLFTDLTGNFRLSIKTDKTYCILVECIGYTSREIKSTELYVFSDVILQPLQ